MILQVIAQLLNSTSGASFAAAEKVIRASDHCSLCLAEQPGTCLIRSLNLGFCHMFSCRLRSSSSGPAQLPRIAPFTYINSKCAECSDTQVKTPLSFTEEFFFYFPTFLASFRTAVTFGERWRNHLCQPSKRLSKARQTVNSSVARSF